jgi:2-polyprenyl-6-methoxyphenol hydroxylase-like FAD-dependent oxidoreductase
MTAPTQVLIVGAGPVGLVAAIALGQRGIRVRIIDEHTASTKRTYPVLLHPQTLRVLHSLGVSEALTWCGRFVRHLAVYADNSRRVVLDLPSAEELAPGAMTLPQDALRQALMVRLSALGTEVEWQTRLVALDQDPDSVRMGLIRRARVEGAAPELRPEWVDVAAESAEAQFVVGADGIASTVRKTLGIEMIEHGQHETYVFYDTMDGRAGDEAHLVLTGGYASSVYPLHGGQSRFSFRIATARPFEPGLMELGRLLADRMPWYAAQPSSFEWCGSNDFQPAVASSFGEGRVWLAGDAAHSTGPLGAQSINVGMQEADELTLHLAENLAAQRGALGTAYAAGRRLEWNRLLGFGPSAPSLPHAPAWVGREMPQLLAALPVSGDDLQDVLEQLRVRKA